MIKIYSKKIKYGLGILAVLTFVALTIPAKVNADQIRAYGSTESQWQIGNSQNYYYSEQPVQNTNPNYYYGAVNNNTIPANYSATPIIYSNNGITKQTTQTTVAEANTNAKTKTSSPQTENKLVADGYGALATNAVFGSVGFYPSGLVQWLIFAILVLVAVILVRKIFGFSDNYDSTPMKQA